MLLWSLNIGQSQIPVPSFDGAGLYTLRVPVDEVSLSFHAADFQGLPIERLKVSELSLFDNGKRSREIVSFEEYQNLPIRAGILFDTSRSMMEYFRQNLRIASMFSMHLLHKETDRAFVMRFDSEAKIKQDWTSDAGALSVGLQTVAADHNSRLGGTALFDALYKACRDQWTSNRGAATANFILLFTDGLDNASHARIEDVIDICQHTRTAIYVFYNEPKSIFSVGQKTLDLLVKQSGGQIFFGQADFEILRDLRIMEEDQRSQYRLVYKPSNLKRDGSFHHLKLDSSIRGGAITAPSGYYAAR